MLKNPAVIGARSPGNLVPPVVKPRGWNLRLELSEVSNYVVFRANFQGKKIRPPP
jgi:hypothetical protein